MFNRAEIVDRNFVQFLRDADHLAVPPRDPELPVRPGSTLDGHGLLELFESQLMSRHLDLMARQMRARDVGFYSIGSAGHEGNVVLGRVARHTDPAFLHYRSGALMMERARQVPGIDPIHDTLLSLAASGRFSCTCAGAKGNGPVCREETGNPLAKRGELFIIELRFRALRAGKREVWQ